MKLTVPISACRPANFMITGQSSALRPPPHPPHPRTRPFNSVIKEFVFQLISARDTNSLINRAGWGGVAGWGEGGADAGADGTAAGSGEGWDQ